MIARRDGYELSDEKGRIDLEGLLVVLATDDAHALYRRFGFEPIDADRFMSFRRRPQ